MNAATDPILIATGMKRLSMRTKMQPTVTKTVVIELTMSVPIAASYKVGDAADADAVIVCMV